MAKRKISARRYASVAALVIARSQYKSASKALQTLAAIRKRKAASISIL